MSLIGLVDCGRGISFKRIIIYYQLFEDKFVVI